LCYRSGFDFEPTAFFEILEVSGQAQMQILLFGKFPT
jgi:hypothetical protein